MADYPDSIYSPRTKANRSGVVYDDTKQTVIFAEDIVNDDDEIVAIETELGANPRGSYASVAAYLAALATNEIFSRFIDLVTWIADIDLMSWNSNKSETSTIDFMVSELQMLVTNTANNYAVVCTRAAYRNIVAAGKLLTVEFQIAELDSVATNNVYLDFVAATYPYIPGDDQIAVGFIVKNGEVFGHCATGAAHTDTTTGVTLSTGDQRTRLRFVFNPGTDCKFYVNDVLKCTITTNLPTTATLYAQVGVKTLAAAYVHVSFGRILIKKEY